ncbi:uncharacterized protein LOC113232739 [Hyposmocoma kahamanoa]|uniref:uncharacterized protein LOC113232739 n=1 Tax=Hyposmocoma kahamanoa TaxID=1477025 RepID=UPI000E6DA4A7|nr:uncharacterized protein LOC113232739 [Hyposmocoma kahamanoa]
MIKRFSTSEAQRIRQLISGKDLGDRKPSVFLRHLRSLSPNLTDETILRELFLQRLPRTVQATLTAQAELSLEKIAELTDKILEVTPSSTGIVCATALLGPSNNELVPIIAQLQALSKQVAALSTRHLRSRSSSRRSCPRPRSATPHGLCWYYRRYQGKGVKCPAVLLVRSDSGKPREQPAVMALADCSQFTGRRLFVTDKVTKFKFLLDTGSDLSCFPRKLLSTQCKVSDYTLSAANGNSIKIYGSRTFSLNLGLRREFRWNFTIADVEIAIIGSNFLAYFNLLPDCRNKLLRDDSTRLSVLPPSVT